VGDVGGGMEFFFEFSGMENVELLSGNVITNARDEKVHWKLV
jgi:hypothetical protein